MSYKHSVTKDNMKPQANERTMNRVLIW